MSDPDPDNPLPPEPPEPPEAKPKVTPELRDARKQLEAERRARADIEQKLRELEGATRTDHERAIAQAVAEAEQRTMQKVGARLAAEVFARLATGKLYDPKGAAEEVNLAKYVGEDGEPDEEAIAIAVDRLASKEPEARRPSAPSVPNGVRPADADGGDWLRAAMHQR
jgi:hypothetical protein